jgi:hypothetical protein
MLLAPVEDIIGPLGADDMPDINAAVTAALQSATTLLEAAVGTPFDKVTLTDTFYIQEPTVVQGPSVQTQLRLRRGFVQSVASVWYASALADFGLGHTVIDFSTLVLDAEKGILRDYVTAYARSYLRVTYTAGFDPHPSDPETYDPAQVPEWLQQAAKLRAQISLATQPAAENAPTTLDPKTLGMELGTIVAAHRRYAPLALMPI